VWLDVGLKDPVGAPLKQDKFPVHDNLLLFIDAFDASLRSMSLNGKLPAKLIKLCEGALLRLRPRPSRSRRLSKKPWAISGMH